MKTGQFVNVSRPTSRSIKNLPDTGKVVEVLEDGTAWVSFIFKEGRALILRVEKVVSEWLPTIVDETSDLVAKIKLLLSSLPERVEIENENGEGAVYNLTLRPAAGRNGVDTASFEFIKQEDSIKRVVLGTLYNAQGETMTEAKRNLKHWLKENNYI